MALFRFFNCGFESRSWISFSLVFFIVSQMMMHISILCSFRGKYTEKMYPWAVFKGKLQIFGCTSKNVDMTSDFKLRILVWQLRQRQAAICIPAVVQQQQQHVNVQKLKEPFLWFPKGIIEDHATSSSLSVLVPHL